MLRQYQTEGLGPIPVLEVREVTDPVEVERLRRGMEEWGKNADWFQAHLSEFGPTVRGKYIAVSMEELFVGDSPAEVRAQAKAKHPDDWPYVQWMPAERRVFIG